MCVSLCPPMELQCRTRDKPPMCCNIVPPPPYYTAPHCLCWPRRCPAGLHLKGLAVALPLVVPSSPSKALRPGYNRTHTFACESAKQLISLGMIDGRQAASCFAEQYAIDPSNSMAVHLVRQLLSSRNSRRMGRTWRTPWSVAQDTAPRRGSKQAAGGGAALSSGTGRGTGHHK